ncbi:MAG: hypothetical protein L6R37_008109 [Teloschistes peruensis]|nr:MAG: hypothetical protein L6R37_008109 [Teloschistes peruensis]
MAKGKANTRAPCTPGRRRRFQRLRDPTSGRFIASGRVEKGANSNPISQGSLTAGGKRIEFEGTGRLLFQESCLPLNEQINQGDRSTPEAPETPDSAQHQTQAESLWSLVTPKRSFWDPIVGTTQDQGPSTTSEGEMDLDAMMTHLTNSISGQHHINIIQGSIFPSSSPRPRADPRDLLPLSSAEEQDLRLAIWPTVQHLVELTSSPSLPPLTPNPQEDYLTQLRGLLNRFAVGWQLSGERGNLPTAFSLEAWNGPISQWRTSHYTNGALRFPASVVLAHLDNWRSSPSPFSPFLRPMDRPMVLDTIPSPTLALRRPIFHLPRRPTVPLRRRSALAPIHDGDPDFGLGPTGPQIADYQAFPSAATTDSRPFLARRPPSRRPAEREEFVIHVDMDALETMEGMDRHLGSRGRRVPRSDSPTRDQENLRMGSWEMQEMIRAEDRANGWVEEEEDEADVMIVSPLPSLQRAGREWLRVNRSWDLEG